MSRGLQEGSGTAAICHWERAWTKAAARAAQERDGSA